MTLSGFLASVVIFGSGIVVPNTNLVCGRDMGGVYIIPTQTIIACEGQKQPEFVKYHEVGHHYYFALLTEAQRKKYKKEFDRATYCFRDYSCNDVQEDFADAFAYAHLYKDTKNKDLIKRMRLVKFLTKTYGKL